MPTRQIGQEGEHPKQVERIRELVTEGKLGEASKEFRCSQLAEKEVKILRWEVTKAVARVLDDEEQVKIVRVIDEAAYAVLDFGLEDGVVEPLVAPFKQELMDVVMARLDGEELAKALEVVLAFRLLDEMKPFKQKVIAIASKILEKGDESAYGAVVTALPSLGITSDEVVEELVNKGIMDSASALEAVEALYLPQKAGPECD
jgi:hypothetical protein